MGAGICIPLFKPTKPFSLLPRLTSPFPRYSRLRCPSLARTRKMAQPEMQNHSPEVKEPVPKVPKLHQNGVDEPADKEPAPFFKVVRLSEKAILPSRGSPLSAGYDLSSACEAKVPARGKALINTDLSIAVPPGTYARIAPRSGLAWKHSIDVGAGVIDADYRGPVGVILFNHSDVDFEVKAGDRIAQLIIEKIVTPEVVEVDSLDSTQRGEGGFGSTGM
ncbi:deoxyuridine 5'-triphosphate nucleotidohydrolase [Punica granatum]|uniref:Deoxyuridine 5'-triphosphate nucleotidohydrolase n=2 Tax=Punica granatum TaxID=22663 RepID=A0A6P8CN01_PUNGR|nr:deoxyuridine 5'-triphosphate nucleotidohydrolase [Punica granatum]XP_031384898.1 deoxyuridine 5'-triphosphate nucleotidohydrolase [Punica granatum]